MAACGKQEAYPNYPTCDALSAGLFFGFDSNGNDYVHRTIRARMRRRALFSYWMKREQGGQSYLGRA